MNPARILYSLAAPLLGHLGSAVLHAARGESDRADAAELNEARALGRAEHADETSAAAYRAHGSLVHDVAVALAERDEARREIATLRSELDCAAVDDDYVATVRQALADTVKERDALLNASAKHAGEVNALRTELAAAKEDVRASSAMGAIGAARFGEIHGKADAADKRAEECCVKLAAAEARIESMTTRLDESAVSLRAEVERNYQAVRDVNTIRARVRELEGQIDARADVKADKCAWCLGTSSGGFYVQDTDGTSFVPTCDECFDRTTSVNIAKRATVRAASCPTRRTSPDPLAVVCTLGCGAIAGAACRVAPVPEDAF